MRNNLNNIENINNITSNDYYKFYLCASRFLSIIWIFFTLSFALIVIIVFLSPNWIGDTFESSNRGYFGLYSFCTRNFLTTGYTCIGSWNDYSTFPNETSIFKASSFFIGFACIISLISILTIPLGVLLKFERIFHFIAWLQCSCSKLNRFYIKAIYVPQ